MKTDMAHPEVLAVAEELASMEATERESASQFRWWQLPPPLRATYIRRAERVIDRLRRDGHLR